MRVAEQLGRQRRAVVDHNGYGVPSGGEPRGEVIALRSADIVALTGQVAVYVHLGGFGALQGELDALLLPLFRDDHLAAVPGTAHIARHTGQVGSLLTGGRGVALAVGVDGAGQHHVVAVDHLLHGQALLISGKLPFTAQVYAARGSGILCLGHKGSCHQAEQRQNNISTHGIYFFGNNLSSQSCNRGSDMLYIFSFRVIKS